MLAKEGRGSLVCLLSVIEVGECPGVFSNKGRGFLGCMGHPPAWGGESFWCPLFWVWGP